MKNISHNFVELKLIYEINFFFLNLRTLLYLLFNLVPLNPKP